MIIELNALFWHAVAILYLIGWNIYTEIRIHDITHKK